MIIDLPSTTVAKIGKELVRVREDGGVVALGRVLTLVIATREELLEESIDAANDASREHPMRVIVLILDPQGEARMDAEIRVGGDAGASEVVVLRAYGAAAADENLVTGLLLPDAPVVAWWPDEAPARPSESALGRIAQRRITDAATGADSLSQVRHLTPAYAPGDTDLSWTRLTTWREQLAAVLDQPPYEGVTAVEVEGALTSPSTPLLAAWLGLKLDVPVSWIGTDDEEWSAGIRRVSLIRASGTITLERPQPGRALLTQPGQPDHELPFPRRSLRECLAEELRHLDPDLLYGRVVTQALSRLAFP